MTTTQIEFTDRYGGNAPSSLRACRGDCEAMGTYPVPTIEGDAASEWAFVTCDDCDGTGRCSYGETVRRIPRWFVRGVRFLWMTRPSSDYWKGHPAGFWRRVWVNIKAAYLCDLGVRM